MENFDNAAFGVRIVNLRKEKNLPQSKLAELTGITQQTLSRYEKGERQASLDFVIHAAAVFGVSADYLLGLSDVRSTEQDIQAACITTGLTEKALLNIKRITGGYLGDISTAIFASGAFRSIISRFSNALLEAREAAWHADFSELDEKEVAPYASGHKRNECYKLARVSLLDAYEGMKWVCDDYFKNCLKAKANDPYFKEVSDNAQHHTTEE